MNTSKTSTPNIQDIVLGTREVMNAGSGEVYEKWNQENALNNFVALASFIGLCNLTEEGESSVRQAWASLASTLEVTEEELLDHTLNSE